MKTTDLSRVIGAIPDLPDYVDREKATLAERDAEIARLRARVEELEAAQAWHPASELPKKGGKQYLIRYYIGSDVEYMVDYYESKWQTDIGCNFEWRELPPAPKEDA